MCPNEQITICLSFPTFLTGPTDIELVVSVPWRHVKFPHVYLKHVFYMYALLKPIPRWSTKIVNFVQEGPAQDEFSNLIFMRDVLEEQSSS